MSEADPATRRELVQLSAEDLLVCKMLFDRPKDWIDVEAVVRANPDTIDRRYLDEALGLFVQPSDERFHRLHELLGE